MFLGQQFGFLCQLAHSVPMVQRAGPMYRCTAQHQQLRSARSTATPNEGGLSSHNACNAMLLAGIVLVGPIRISNMALVLVIFAWRTMRKTWCG